MLGDAGRDLIRTMLQRGYMIAYPERALRLPRPVSGRAQGGDLAVREQASVETRLYLADT
jgi:hypothetical protein